MIFLCLMENDQSVSKIYLVIVSKRLVYFRCSSSVLYSWLIHSAEYLKEV